jgi:hypothetical protein
MVRLVKEIGTTSHFDRSHSENAQHEQKYVINQVTQTVPARTSPGTAHPEPRERNFWKELGITLHQQGMSTVKSPLEVTGFLHGQKMTLLHYMQQIVWHTQDEQIQKILDQECEPITVKERILYLVKRGRVKFVIDDLDAANVENLQVKVANKYGINQLPQAEDTCLYPRFHPDRAPSGVLSFLVCAYMDEKGIISEDKYEIMLDEIREVEYWPYMFIHLSKRVWVLFHNDLHFLAQVLIHELVEHLANSLAGINPHQVGILYEMFFTSERARQIGISDVDIFIVKHAAYDKNNFVYLNRLIQEYKPENDLSLGSFYEFVWELCDEKGWVPTEQKKDYAQVRLRDVRLAKNAPGVVTENTTAESRKLEQLYRGKGKEYRVPENVIENIATLRTSRIYNPLKEYIDRGKLIFRVDDLGNNIFMRVPHSQDWGRCFSLYPMAKR